MRQLLQVMVLGLWLPGHVMACDYPASLRVISATLVAVQDRGGQVAPSHRVRLRQALGSAEAQAGLREFAGQLRRADRRAVTGALVAANALAAGTARSFDPAWNTQVRDLELAISAACPSQNQQTQRFGPVASGIAEKGAHRTDGVGSAGPGFRQGVARLSLIFAAYLVFLALVVGLRRRFAPPNPPRTQQEAIRSRKGSDARTTG